LEGRGVESREFVKKLGEEGKNYLGEVKEGIKPD
jgi:hypothetical protein